MLKDIIKYVIITIPTMMLFFIIKKIFNRLSLRQAIIVFIFTLFILYFLFANVVKASTVIDDFSYSNGALTTVSGGVWTHSSMKPPGYTSTNFYSPDIVSGEVKSVYSSTYTQHLMSTIYEPSTDNWSSSIDFYANSSFPSSYDTYFYIWDSSNNSYFLRNLSYNMTSGLVSSGYNTLLLNCSDDNLTLTIYNSSYPDGYPTVHSFGESGAITCSGVDRLSLIFHRYKYGYVYVDNFIDESAVPDPNELAPLSDFEYPEITVDYLTSGSVAKDDKTLDYPNHLFCDDDFLIDDYTTDITINFNGFIDFMSENTDADRFVLFSYPYIGGYIELYNEYFVDIVSETILIEDVVIRDYLTDKNINGIVGGWVDDDNNIYGTMTFKPTVSTDGICSGDIFSGGGGGGGGGTGGTEIATDYSFSTYQNKMFASLAGFDNIFPIGFFTGFLGSFLDYLFFDYVPSGVDNALIFDINFGQGVVLEDVDLISAGTDVIEDAEFDLRTWSQYFLYLFFVLVGFGKLNKWWHVALNVFSPKYIGIKHN